jgi:hypothetical protein
MIMKAREFLRVHEVRPMMLDGNTEQSSEAKPSVPTKRIYARSAKRRGYKMDIEGLEIAIRQARWFLERAVHAKEIMEGKPAGPLGCSYKGTGYGPANAAARRSSMDLTRALAQLRKY